MERLGLPAMMTLGAEPMLAGMTVCHDLGWGQPILGCVPAGCHSWGHGQQLVVLAQTVVGAIRALSIHILPVIDSGHSLMPKPVGTLVTTPPHAQVVACPDLLVSQMLILGMMPLPLQLWPEQADVGAC